MACDLSDKQLVDLLLKCHYKYIDLAKRDISQALIHFKDLVPVQEDYDYLDGSVKDLVSLKGIIPVNYNGSKYNIPIQLYLDKKHPHVAPICYVRPTPEMSIKVSNMVDFNGRINLSLLKEWKTPNSTLYLLLSLMSMKFSDKTPLFSRPMLPFKSFSSGEHSLYPSDFSKLNILTKPKQEYQEHQPPVKSLFQVEIDHLKRVNKGLNNDKLIDQLINEAEAEALHLVYLESELKKKTVKLNETISLVQTHLKFNHLQ